MTEHDTGVDYGALFIQPDLKVNNIKEIPMLDVQNYVRKPFEVQATQVTAENIDLVATWCNGTVKRLGVEGKDDRYVKVNVRNPQTPRHARAEIGDWVLASGDPKRPSYKVYLEKAFPKAFDAKDKRPRNQKGAEQLVELLTTDEPASVVSDKPTGPSPLAMPQFKRQPEVQGPGTQAVLENA